MQTVDKLFTNSTNRLPFPLRLCLSHFKNESNNMAKPTNSSYPSNRQSQYEMLEVTSINIQQQLNQAQQEQLLMMELFSSMGQFQRSSKYTEGSRRKPWNRKILIRYNCQYVDCHKYYNSRPSLERHIKIKHGSVKNQPPELYSGLPPQPNSTQTTKGLKSDQDNEEEGGSDKSENKKYKP